ncbi:hypothetical protein L7F22_030729 [Adiantum nelumboides]|nr:hypothetical protein [Adiantum nelumboides]
METVLSIANFKSVTSRGAFAHAQQNFAGLVNCAEHMLMPLLMFMAFTSHVHPLQLVLSTRRPSKKKRKRNKEACLIAIVGGDVKRRSCIKEIKRNLESLSSKVGAWISRNLLRRAGVFDEDGDCEKTFWVLRDAGVCSSKQEAVVLPVQLYSATTELLCNQGVSTTVLKISMRNEFATSVGLGTASAGEPMPSIIPRRDARSRWKRLTHTVTLINHMVGNIRSASTDLLEGNAANEVDAGGLGAATFEGAKMAARFRCKGRKGMEGLLVRQGTGFLSFFQGFYVAFLKMPICYFSIGVLFAPIVLGMLFTPVYLLDVDGLTFNGSVSSDATVGSYAGARQHFLTFLNVFLYALSLSTTFGGSPIDAHSPFCLLLANMNTLMAQFLFVFLSGAVFARMSQPSYPMRFSKKAIIKTDDLLPVLGLEQQEIHKVFGVILVLTGPSPCELVDVKICLTFRIFVKLPSGSVFCSTQDLEITWHARDPRFTSLFWKAIWENIGTRLQFSSSFHPQTDGQSEIANSVVLDLLKSYISDQKTQWERCLPLVEFAYNNTIHSSTGKTPFEIVEGVRKNSQERQKKAADRHRRDSRLKENDWVLLRFDKACLRQKKGKEELSMRYYGPFQITEQINDISFRLRLPDTWKIHNVFDVNLWKTFGDVPNDGEPGEQPEVEENEEILVPEQVLAQKVTKKRKARRQFLIKFKNFPAFDAKWMEEEDLANTPQILKLYLEAFGLA